MCKATGNYDLRYSCRSRTTQKMKGKDYNQNPRSWNFFSNLNSAKHAICQLVKIEKYQKLINVFLTEQSWARN